MDTKNKVILGFQHVLAMFGATVLVPALTGLDFTLALLSAGIGTLLFHWLTGRVIPIFLGSSFAYIGAIALILQQSGLGSVKTGLIAAGIVYTLVALIVRWFGKDLILKILPPVVVGPVISVIGLRLSPVALNMSGYNLQNGSWDITSLILAASVTLVVIVIANFTRGFFKLVPILFGIIFGYVLGMILGVVDYSTIAAAPWLGFSGESWQALTTLPRLDGLAIVAIAPIALVTIVEHVGDVVANGAVVNKDFITKPGLHRTLLGDGLATVLAGFLGAPANTTYSENTGVLAVTKVYDPVVIRIAAVFAIAFSLIGKVGGILGSIPVAVMGGVSIILFGMIAAIGLKTVISANLDFRHSRNLIITAIILVVGIAVNTINIGSLTVSGLTLAVILGIILNVVLPKEN